MQKPKNISITLILAVALAFLTSCGGDGEKISLDSTPAAANVADPVEVATTDTDDATEQLGTARLESNNGEYLGVGSFVAEEDVTISTKVAGTLLSVPKDTGDMVGPDTLVALLDKENFQLALENARAQFEIAEASLKNARSEFDRKKQLFDEGAIPVSIFDQFRTKLELAEAQKKGAIVAVNIAEKALRDTEVRSGVAGVVSRRFVAAGEYIDRGKPIIVVSKLNPIKLVFSVPGRLASRIKEGTPVSARVEAYPGRTFSGEVSLVSPTADPVTRTIQIEAMFDNSRGMIMPGFFSECTVNLEHQTNIFLVPNSALFSTEDGLVVRVRTDDGFSEVPVYLVQRLEGSSRVSGDLKGGEKLELQY